MAILTLTIWSFVEMILRFGEHERVVNNKMFVVAAFALVFKLAQMKKLHSREGNYDLSNGKDDDHEKNEESEEIDDYCSGDDSVDSNDCEEKIYTGIAKSKA